MAEASPAPAVPASTTPALGVVPGVQALPTPAAASTPLPDADDNSPLKEYRQHLVEAEQKAQDDLDKTILSLSGGALGISFVFLKDIIGNRPVEFEYALIAAWICWAVSTLAVLLSFHVSHVALRRAIRKIDDGTIEDEEPGGPFARLTQFLNLAGAALFVVGVLSITLFASMNMHNRGVKDDRKEGSTAASTAAAAAAAASGSDQRSSDPRRKGAAN
jgi:hypothetical protein